MIPIIFAIAFTSFPYLLSQIMTKVQISNTFLTKAASWIESNFNIYTNSPSLIVIAFYFVLIVMFTFFYAMIQFNPEKIADNIQRR
jgi:preprotein translocase subunit SecY